MNIRIRNNQTHRETYYTPAQLKVDAKFLVKQYGRLHAFDVVVNEGGSVQLIASYITKDGNCGSITQVI
jgi:hypothetical protein